MSHTSTQVRHPLVTSLLVFSFLICGSAALAATNVLFSAAEMPKASPTNPHRIPDQLDPKSQALSDEIALIKSEIREEVAEVDQTIHSVAFQDNHEQSKPILDYTTGTSN